MLLPEFKRGDTFELPLAVAERAPGGNMVPVDISDWVIRMSAREESATGKIVQVFSFQITDALNGKGFFFCPPEATRRWPLKTLVLDIVIRDAQNKEITSRTIQLPVFERVTR